MTTTELDQSTDTGFNKLDIAKIFVIKQLIEHKLTDFNNTIRKLGPMHTHSYFLTGGAIGSLIRSETPKDWDIYFFDESYANTIFNLYEKCSSTCGARQSKNEVGNEFKIYVPLGQQKSRFCSKFNFYSYNFFP